MGQTEDVRRRLEADLPRLLAAGEVPGATVAVLVDGQTVEASAGVVNLRTGVETTPDAVFMIQSITKVWTATLVMQLVDEGLVDLDVPVRVYLPGFRTDDEQASAEITARHLLAHTGGFEGDIWAPTTSGEDALQHFVDDLVASAPQHSRPGDLYSYCSAGYGVLGRLVEVLRERPYESAFRHYLAGPLGIEELAFCADQALRFRTAIGHARPTPDTAQRPMRAWAVMPPSNPAAGNQLAMSARALLAFARMHLADGLAPDGTRVLSDASAKGMRERQVDHPAAVGAASGHGLGWWLSSRPGVVEHGGDAIGVAAMLRIVPDAGVAIAVMTNGGTPRPLIDELVEPLLGELAAIPPLAKIPTPDGSARVADPQRYVGRYATRTSVHDATLAEDGRLWLTTSSLNEAMTMAKVAGVRDDPERHELRPLNSDNFILIGPAGSGTRAVEFLGRDGAGRAQLIHTGRAARRTT